ncbi:MAG: CotH kinase family protein [Flavobacteriales bacterium]|nr:CotH kinase family protein [Flavobacteriales bacterium]
MIIAKHLLIAFSILIAYSCIDEKIPTLNIKKDGAIGWKEKEECNIIYSDSQNIDELKAKIKCRGGMSSKYYKHSFSLELKNKYSLAKLSHDDDWIINANYIDKTFMRHKISYDLFREMNSENVASKSGYINVSINDKYEGLYLLMEEINASMIGLNKNDTMAMLFKDPPIFKKERMTNDQNSLNYYQQKYPKINKLDKAYYIKEFIDFLFNTSDKAFSKKIDSWVDISNVIDWHIILLFSNNGDGIMKNFYLYKIDKNTPFKFAIWDYDHSFGRDGDNERNLMERELDCNRAILLERLSKISEIGYLFKLKRRWFELRKQNIISFENFDKHINNNDKRINKEVDKNFEKWPLNSKWYYDDNDYNQELDLMKDFVKVRINQLDEYFNNLYIK